MIFLNLDIEFRVASCKGTCVRGASLACVWMAGACIAGYGRDMCYCLQRVWVAIGLLRLRRVRESNIRQNDRRMLSMCGWGRFSPICRRCRRRPCRCWPVKSRALTMSRHGCQEDRVRPTGGGSGNGRFCHRALLLLLLSLRTVFRRWARGLCRFRFERQ